MVEAALGRRTGRQRRREPPSTIRRTQYDFEPRGSSTRTEHPACLPAHLRLTRPRVARAPQLPGRAAGRHEHASVRRERRRARVPPNRRAPPCRRSKSAAFSSSLSDRGADRISSSSASGGVGTSMAMSASWSARSGALARSARARASLGGRVPLREQTAGHRSFAASPTSTPDASRRATSATMALASSGTARPTRAASVNAPSDAIDSTATTARARPRAGGFTSRRATATPRTGAGTKRAGRLGRVSRVQRHLGSHERLEPLLGRPHVTLHSAAVVQAEETAHVGIGANANASSPLASGLRRSGRAVVRATHEAIAGGCARGRSAERKKIARRKENRPEKRELVNVWRRGRCGARKSEREVRKKRSSLTISGGPGDYG